MGAKGSGCSSLNESGNRRTVAGPRQMCRPSRLNFDQRQPCGPRPSPHAYPAGARSRVSKRSPRPVRGRARARGEPPPFQTSGSRSNRWATIAATSIAARSAVMRGRRSRSEATDFHRASGRPTASSGATSANDCEKGTPPRREGLSEAGVFGGGRKRPADKREPIVRLKSGISNVGISRAPIGRGTPYLRLTNEDSRRRTGGWVSGLPPSPTLF